ncbi:MAG: hydrogen peroxide-inducible genes activator [Parabacteroides sp.]|nr:hydrogen peroxide-inducible genes activator [Parabacteroides sp.]MDO4756777.1 hydrogen peroxide-inducible genes activator [Parabacteroides sp.]
MTLQQMEYIVAVDKYRHFANAAESCGITQSTLSSLVQKLEAELNVTIFDRNCHPVKPTSLGEEIIKQAKVLLFNASQIEELVATRKGESIGKVHLGIASTIAPYILPQMFKYLSKHHPDIQLYVEEARVETIIQKLERAELDVALLATPLNNKELLEIPIYQERFLAYVSPKEPIYGQKELQTSMLPAQNAWVLREGYCPNRGVFPFCHSQSEKWPIYEAGSIETLVKIVDENGGFAIIPELHVPLLRNCQQNHIHYLHNPEPSREIAFVVRHDYVRERLLNILADAIKSIIPSHMINQRLKKFAIKL